MSLDPLPQSLMLITSSARSLFPTVCDNAFPLSMPITETTRKCPGKLDAAPKYLKIHVVISLNDQDGGGICS